MTSYRIPIPGTAFSAEPTRRIKRGRITAETHLRWIRTLPCLVCGTHRDIEAAHIRAGNPAFGKLPAGAGKKSDDQWVVPLCAEHHRTGRQALHEIGEAAFFARHGIAPHAVASALCTSSGDDEAAELIIREARVRR